MITPRLMRVPFTGTASAKGGARLPKAPEAGQPLEKSPHVTPGLRLAPPPRQGVLRTPLLTIQQTQGGKSP